MSADDLYVDPGPTWDAAVALVGLSTLADHVLVDHDEHAIRFQPANPVPIGQWGTATMGLWALLESMTHGQLRQLATRCDQDNKTAAAFALIALFRQP